MSNHLVRNIIRFVLFGLVQVLILKNVEIYPPYIHILIYPLFIILLPLDTKPWAVLGLAFLMGVAVGTFYDDVGLHAAALVITGYARINLLALMEPRGGYDANQYPNKNLLGMGWFLQFSGILMAIHIFFYFMFDAFLFAQIGLVLVKTVLSFTLTMVLVVVHQYITSPSN